MASALNSLPQKPRDVVAALLAEGVSSIDGPGWVYAYVIVGGSTVPNTLLVKVGASNDWERRMSEWEAQCFGEEQVWLVKIPAFYRFLTERVTHAILEHEAVSRPIKKCQYCGRFHQERFVMRIQGPFGSNVEEAVIEAIERAIKIVAEFFDL
ncbi:hypothetical protein V5O48_001846 [Marasmius crinis-equi]|uniref:Bacteriophage T5 Orf172 DNA-binding domain-containing protein n=1 Tax=Marasmius crinis-equi TaxID=585013 RepID=A0ABR3FY32_9AGAR